MADDRLLLETGDALLLESGDALLLDVAPDPLVHVYLGRTHSLSVGSANIPITAGVIATAGFAGYTEVVCPLAGTIRNLVVRLVSAPGGSTTRSVTLYKNGSATALTVAFGSADTEQRDETNDIAVTAGDRLRLFADSSGSPVTTDAFWTLEWESADAVSSWYGATAIGDSGYVDPFTGETSGTADGCLRLIPCDGTITALAGMNTFLTLSGSTKGLNLYVYKNGVKQNGSSGTIDTKLAITNVAQNTMVSVAFELPVVRGDTVYVGIEEFGTYPASWTTMAMVFEATTFGQSIVASRGAGTPSTSAANYHVIQGQSDGDQVWGGTLASSTVRRYAGTSDFTLRDLILTVTVAPGATKTRTFEVMQNGSVPASPPAGVITNTELEIDDVGHSIVFSDGDIVGPLQSTPSGTPTSTGIEYWSLIMGPASPTPPTPPTGGGGVATGTNPSAGNLPTTLPLKFVQVKIDGTDYYFSETGLSDPTAWYGGWKAGKLAGISRVRRDLSRDGAFVTSRATITLADTDRQFRALAGTAAFRGAYVALYVVADSVRRAQGTPFRYFAGLITAHRATPGFGFEIDIEDVMGRRLSEYAKQPQLPPDKFSTTVFPGLDASAEGKAIPIALGLVSDADAVAPQGVVPPTYVGGVNFSTYFGGADLETDAYVWSQGAFNANGIWEVYYNDPATPSTRVIVPAAAWGTVAWSPGQTGWNADTGLATDYVDYTSRRYMALFVLRSDPIAQAIREGNVFVAANLYGVAENGDGTGDYINEAANIWQFLLVNYVFTRYTTGSYAAVPALDGTYSIIDTTTVTAVNAVHTARLATGYVVGFLLGRGGQAQTVFDVMQELALGADFDWGINRHGQLMVSAEDVAAASIATFTAQHDIEEGSYETWIDRDRFFNRLEHTWGFRYMPPVAPPATPTTGEPVPTKLAPYADWRSGFVTLNDTASQTDTGEIVTFTLNNYVVQDLDTAEDVAARVLARALGPNGDGPKMFRFTTGWQGLGSGSSIVELGSVITVTHPERIGTSATASDTCRVLAIEVDPLRDRVTLEGMVIA